MIQIGKRTPVNGATIGLLLATLKATGNRKTRRQAAWAREHLRRAGKRAIAKRKAREARTAGASA